MEKHGNTWFPGDSVVKSGEKTASGKEKVGFIVEIDPGMELAKVTWQEGGTEWVNLDAISKP